MSMDSPLESKRFADAEIGKGFVVRAGQFEYRPGAIRGPRGGSAKENGIPAQYSVTGGGNDGSVFLRYGSADVALGWPLRYSHSPGEVIDTKDVGDGPWSVRFHEQPHSKNLFAWDFWSRSLKSGYLSVCG